MVNPRDIAGERKKKKNKKKKKNWYSSCCPAFGARQTHHQDGDTMDRLLDPTHLGPRADYTITTLAPTFDDTLVDNPRGHSCVTNFTLKDYSIGSLISSSSAALPGTWRYRVSAGNGWTGVSVLWQGDSKFNL